MNQQAPVLLKRLWVAAPRKDDVHQVMQHAQAGGLHAGVFQHANIRTPGWLGYIIQRPEQHCVHHERGVHAFNYANLPLWDMVFGTFKNPRVWQRMAGFYSGSSQPTKRMLLDSAEASVATT